MAKKTRKKRKRKKKLADLADPLKLYQLSVQCPEVEIDFFTSVYRRHRKRRPLSMKEDFCGTAYLATDWVKSHKKRTAVGVDLDAPTLAWARKHVLGKAKPGVRDRVQLIEANVLDVTEPKVDVTCALNFSYCGFKTRELLRRYFSTAREGLAEGGIFFCELYGGTEAIIELEEEREVEDFTYVWHQAKFNPITRETLCHIHFDFPDGSRLEQAFTYDWRLWTIPEVRECLDEAGFSHTEIYWDPVDNDDADEGFRLTEEEENQEGWLVYIVGLK